MSVWKSSTTPGCYSHYFASQRPIAPEDTCIGDSITEQSNADAGDITTHVQWQDFSALSHPIRSAKLDIYFVEAVLSSTGPLLENPAESVFWQWTFWLLHIRKKAATEQDYYPWLEWVVFRPAAHAVSAVRDRLYQEADIEVPQTLRGFSTTRSVSETKPRGVTDILHMLDRGEDAAESACTAHEVKRSKVLRVRDLNVLENLVYLASLEGGWAFRDAEVGLQEKARRLLCQCIDKLITNDVTHIILATPEQYALLFLDGFHQFRISRVYIILGSVTQARDMAELVLFYTHALLTRQTPYPRSPSPSTSVYRITVPAFSPRLFQPQEALFCNGPLIHRSKLAALRPIPNKSIPRLYPSNSTLLMLHVGMKETSLSPSVDSSSALDRLLHEFAVYDFLRALQGVVIPSLFGLYRNLNDGSSILVISYAGGTLADFDTLCLKDRQKLLLRVVRLHQAGVVHNDLEPRNIVFSERLGPRIIDFDNATLGHTCTGLSCKELCDISHRLGLDLSESRTLEDRTLAASTVLVAVSIVMCLDTLHPMHGDT
ncbi:hypothetical protein C8J57DRAFT_1732409 [Mycena rebaudengoi]|nr:hypothetical protein C8J57DRAFT_1732409 [Mycena rebaudengoi]